jgi:hypothetical protein
LHGGGFLNNLNDAKSVLNGIWEGELLGYTKAGFQFYEFKPLEPR